MALTATYKRSKQTLMRAYDVGGWSAQMGWSVVGPVSELADDLACQSAVCTSNPIFAIGAKHPASGLLVCTNLNTGPGLTEREVLATFTITSTGALNGSPIYDVQPGSQSISIDRDFNKNPIVNTAGLPLSEHLVEDESIIVINATIQQPYFDINVSVQAKNCTNDAYKSIVALGTGFDEGQGKILCIRPASPLQAGGEPPLVIYSLALRKDGWQQRRVSQSTQGWYNDPTDGKTKYFPFCDTTGQLISTPVLLDSEGLPIDESIRVLVGPNNAQQPNLPPSSLYVPPEKDIDKEANATFVNYTTKGTYDFDSLPI